MTRNGNTKGRGAAPARFRRRREHTRRIAMLAYPMAQVLDITGPLEVFARTSRWLADHKGLRVPAYKVELVASRRGPLATSGGLQLVATRNYRELGRVDTLLVAGGIGYEAAVAADGPAGVEAVAHTMNLAPDTLTDEVEPFLLRIALVVRTPRGRKVTPAAFDHLGVAPPADDDGQRRLF